jgi:putative oxidoreductase
MASLSLPGALGAWEWITSRLRGAGEVIPRLVMRLVMGWEFWESGLEKLHGENWFANIQSDFPFPFNVIPADFSWAVATWAELIGAVLLWTGLFTRLISFKLLVLTFVATAAVHWPDMWSMWSDLLKGYSVSDRGHGNFKLPLLFVVMLLPLIFNGAGKLSLDYLLAKMVRIDTSLHATTDAYAWSLAAAVLGVPFLFLVPSFGIALLVASIALAAFGRFARA